MSKSIIGRGRLRRYCLSIAVVLGSAGSVSAATITAPALRAPGSISYDAEGIATISATSDFDVAFLQGYAHARDRFFEMDYNRRAISGTLAELVGAPALSSDVQYRTLGFRRAAWATWNALGDETRGWLKAYADGVNFYLQTQALPPEYAGLELSKAEYWSPVDSLAIGKALAAQLSFDDETGMTIAYGAYQQAAAAAHVDATALFFGDTHRFAPFDGRVTITGFQPGASESGTPIPFANSAVGAPTMNLSKLVDDDTLALVTAYQARTAGNPALFPNRRATGIGSNEWVIAGSNTASGKPILSNDPHLSLALPSVFVEQHLLSSDSRYAQALNVSGVSVPGAPGIIQGCNQNLCWGTTTNPMDVTDWFKETFHVNSYGLPYAIIHNGQEEPVQWVFQSFFVNKVGDGVADNVARENSIGYLNGAITVIVPRRNNGPVVQISGATGLSVAYTGWGPTFELESFLRFNRATNRAEFETALTYFDVGSQNFAYADTAGNIAYYTSAEQPVREDLQTQNAPGGGIPPWLVRDGSGALKHDWLSVQHPQPNQALAYEILPASEMPHVVNPAAGYFVNANNDPIGTNADNNPLNQVRPGGGLYYLGYGYDSARIGRIDRVIQSFIAGGHKITAADMQALQGNTRMLDAELILPYLLTAYANAATSTYAPLSTLAADAKVQSAIARLRAWNLSSPTGIKQGYDAGDNPLALPTPDKPEEDNSIATTIFSIWRSFAIRNTVDATLTPLGLGSYLPGSNDAYDCLKFVLDNFATLGGKGSSGVNFFNVSGAPNAAAARDFVLLKSLKDGLDRLASADFAPAFGGSTNQDDYKWGALHRITFTHPLGGPFNLPGPNAYGFSDLSAQLPGLARDGNLSTVNPANFNIRANKPSDFMFASGPARRFVGEMSTPINAVEIIPGGESGVLGSPFYANTLGRWLTVGNKPFPIDANVAAAASPTVITFAPH